jgi:hypothetical protein
MNIMPFNWMQELRREQTPQRGEERPTLQLPVPSREPPPGWLPPEVEPEPSRVIIIDM